MEKGYYQNIKNEEDVVRAIWYPSFDDEVIVENFTGILKSWDVTKFLKKYVFSEKKFKPKLERVKETSGGY